MTVADVRWEMPAAICSPGWMRNGGTSTDRSLSVCSSFYTEFLNLDARANPPNPCTRHRFCPDVLSRPGQMHTSSHLGRSSTKTSAAKTLNRLPAPSGQGYPETHAAAACARSCLNRASPLTVVPGPARVHLLSRSNRGVDPGLYSISPRSEVAFSGVRPSPPFSRPLLPPRATMWTSPRPLHCFHERAPCRHIGRVVLWSMLTGEAETCAPRFCLRFQTGWCVL